MTLSNRITQTPPPGTHLLRFSGDIQTFTLSVKQPAPGQAWLRTNLGHADITHKEIFGKVHHDKTPMGRDWYDIPMRRISEGTYQVTLPVCEVGRFEAKCLFLLKGETVPLWPEGTNVIINVEPADTCCANIIYNAFVRQFGPNKAGAQDRNLGMERKKWVQVLDQAGYAVIPPSGTFRDLVQELDFIIGVLGCRILQLLPVHPTPTTYGRMGRFGSPYAALSFTAVDPALAIFDPKATPLEQFIELVDAIHERNAKIIIDIAPNHTGWAASIHETHPQWLERDQDGRIKVPGAWGVLWEDLAKLDYSQKDLWRYMADVFVIWCRRGVDGFRCDAGYMIPVDAWQYIVAHVRDQYPNTLFLLEGLGGKMSVTREILDRANFNWAYSELFQNFDRRQIEDYLPGAMDISATDGTMLHYAETHDNDRLAARSQTFARMRTSLCALFSRQGAFGFANGVEWFATAKIDVHGAPSLNWGAEPNQVAHIQRLNAILSHHPAFFDRTELQLVQQGSGNQVVMLRHHRPSGKKLLVAVNLDSENQTTGCWDFRTAGLDARVMTDLLSGGQIGLTDADGLRTYTLEPGQVLCLTADKEDIKLIERSGTPSFTLPQHITQQRLKAKALEVFRFYHGNRDMGDFDPDTAALDLVKDPLSFCRSLNPFSRESRVVIWLWPRDVKREVMVPPGHFLLVRSQYAFRARIMVRNRSLAQEDSMADDQGRYFALFAPLAPAKNHRSHKLHLSVYAPDRCEHAEAALLFLAEPQQMSLKRSYLRPELRKNPLVFLGTNGRGGMLRAPVAWGELESRYDALLAANLHPEFPVDRWIMFTRCRAWLVFQGYSQELCLDCLESFSFDHRSRGFWHFDVPTGQGAHVLLSVAMEMTNGTNRIQMTFLRHTAPKGNGRLADHHPVLLVLRPDIEDRNFHETTKAYLGPEHHWPKVVQRSGSGFCFTPHPERQLCIDISRGNFTWEPEWQYMVHRPLEAQRGLDPESDLFSPGYFSIGLSGGQTTRLTAAIATAEAGSSPGAADHGNQTSFPAERSAGLTLDGALLQTLDHYVVKREKSKTVIAGYPWFLDWGRDTLIVVRGLIAAGKTAAARSILKAFGTFEKNGTLPNMIRGDDASNRNTSDAPLWFCLACAELVQSEQSEIFLDENCGDRTVRQVIVSLGRAFLKGTANGIRVDPESGLVFSPTHFTWMDTNHPACTPRQGYPIEIQALWFSALTFLNQIDPVPAAAGSSNWGRLAQRVQDSIQQLYWLSQEGYLADCLHTRTGQDARKAEADNFLRPNQLFAITLRAVTDEAICSRILSACEELLVPGAIRSLADRPVHPPLEIRHHEKILNRPDRPYQGRYAGDEDTSRKPAYHNGTAWTWMLPAFCEAWVEVFGNGAAHTARAWLASCTRLLDQGCAGHIPEILDGDFPHTPRGCDAQAWGISELVRVWRKLHPI